MADGTWLALGAATVLAGAAVARRGSAALDLDALLAQVEGRPQSAFRRKLRERAEARSAAQQAQRVERQGLRARFEARAARDRAGQALGIEHKLAHAQALVAAIKAEPGGPDRVRVWSRGDDVRVYWPGQIGYLTMDWSGQPGTMVRGREVFVESALWPSWLRAWRRAKARYLAELEPRMVQFRQEWAATVGDPQA
jgi:hypothetical protein